MNIKTYKREGSHRVRGFIDREWQRADTEHFKRRVHWKTEEMTLVAYKKRRIVGALQFTVAAGVAYPETLVVAQSQRRKGIGKELMDELEKTAKQYGAHKIYLETGKAWGAVKFYKALGYKKSAELPNHYFHGNFVQLTKYVSKN